MLLDRLNLHREHERAIRFLNKEHVDICKQLQFDNIGNNSKSILATTLEGVKMIDARKRTHQFNYTKRKHMRGKLNHEKNAVQHFFNRLPNDIHSITYQQKYQWSKLTDNMEHNKCLERFVHEAIYNPGSIDVLNVLLHHDNRLVLNSSIHIDGRHLANNNGNKNKNNFANIHNTILQTLLHSAKKANSNVYAYDNILSGLRKLITVLISQMHVINAYQIILNIVHPLMCTQKEYSTIFIMYGITIFEILMKYGKQNKYIFSDIMVEYTCLQMKYTLNGILNHWNSNGSISPNTNEPTSRIKHETKEKINYIVKKYINEICSRSY